MRLTKSPNNLFSRVIIILLLAGVVSLAFSSNFFLEPEESEHVRVNEVKGFSFGGNVGGIYYIKGLEAMLEGNLQYRFHEKQALGGFLSFVFPEFLVDLGVDYRFYAFNSFSNLSEDFFHLGFSFSYFEKFDESYFVPKISLSYGKDVRILSSAPFALRFSIGGSYLLGEPLSRKTNSFSVQEAHIVLYVKTGILFF